MTKKILLTLPALLGITAYITAYLTVTKLSHTHAKTQTGTLPQ